MINLKFLYKHFTAFIIFYLIVSFDINAQSPLGMWKSFDHETGEAKAMIKIYQEGNKLFGKIIELLVDDPKEICDHCSGKWKNQPFIGMEIINDLEKDGSYWSGGEVYDPERDQSFRCKIWVENEEKEVLKVRGYFWGLFKTQTWERVN